MSIPRFNIGEVHHNFLCKKVPAMVVCDDGEYVKYHEVERLQEQYENQIKDLELELAREMGFAPKREMIHRIKNGSEIIEEFTSSIKARIKWNELNKEWRDRNLYNKGDKYTLHKEYK